METYIYITTSLGSLVWPDPFCAGRYRLEISAHAKRVWNNSQSVLVLRSTQIVECLLFSRDLMRLLIGTIRWISVGCVCRLMILRKVSLVGWFWMYDWSDKRRRKLLYGSSCETELAVLKLEFVFHKSATVVLKLTVELIDKDVAPILNFDVKRTKLIIGLILNLDFKNTN